MARNQGEFDFAEFDGVSPSASEASRARGKGSLPPPEGDGPFRTLIDTNFLQYASYVVCERAIPALEDGLKPVQRRILHSLHEKDDGRFTKVANIVGHCMQYHPHGDASIADALIALVNKGYLVEGQGNFGNTLTGDQPAAPRYIECRLTDLARNEIFNDALCRFVPSYDGRNKEPVSLPSKLPLLLLLGADGIAVGLSTRVFPHNFREVIEAQIAAVRRKPFSLVPDFPQGGLMDISEYNKGNGRIRLRARIRPKDERSLLVTELPFGTTTESLIASIEDAVRRGKVPVKSINDFTSGKVEIELALAPDTSPDRAIKALYAFTACETSQTGRVVAIRDGKPADMDVESVLLDTAEALVKLLERELRHREKELQDAWHEKTLVQLFIENRIYKGIEQCRTMEAVKAAVISGFEPLSDRLRRPLNADDVEMLLGVRIRRISLFDMEKHRREMDDIARELEQVKKDLSNTRAFAVRYLQGLLKTHADKYPRRTEVVVFDKVEVRELTSTELTLRYDRAGGYLGHAVEGDEMMACSSLDRILLAWNDGRYKVVPPPEKLFVGQGLLVCDRYDRDKQYTTVFTQRDFGFSYMKRFTFGGIILNKEYLFTMPQADVLLLADDDPSEIYLKYKPAKGQRIHQQVFHPREMPVKGVKAQGNQMTAKGIARISASRPKWWDEDSDAPKGRAL
jgi:topoisomerase-4 subunit A